MEQLLVQPKKRNLRTQAKVLVSVLTLQYILGMTVTFFVEFPENLRGEDAWRYAWTQPVLAAHIIVGMLLFIGSIVFVVRAVLRKEKSWIISAIMGLVGIFIAFGGGATFVPSQKDLFSYIMSLGFILALVSYGWGLYKNKV